METSESIKQIAAALCAFSSEVKSIEKNASNPYYKSKYADLSNILKEIKPLLSRNGLSIIQSTKTDMNIAGHNAVSDDFLITIETMIVHTSGEFIITNVTIPGSKKEKNNVKIDAQTVGSALTYGRRYGISAALNIATEDEDDGNACVSNGTAQAKPNGKPKISIEEIKVKINSIIDLKSLELLKKDLWANYSYSVSNDILKNLFFEKEKAIKKVFNEKVEDLF